MRMRILLLLSVLVLGAHNAIAGKNPEKLMLKNALSNKLTIYPDKALVRQEFKELPADDGMLVLYGIEGVESSFELAYNNGGVRYLPSKLLWRKGQLNLESLYRRLVGKPVEVMGGGINVPVQGELMAYNSGLAWVQGNNGRQYIVDWNDSNGFRLASKEPIFTAKDDSDSMIADFGQQKPEGALLLSYLTPLLSYSSEYRLTMMTDDKGRLERNIIIKNDSNTTYSNAKVRLAAGAGNKVSVAYRGLASMANDVGKYSDERTGEMFVTLLTTALTVESHSIVQMSKYRQDNTKFEKSYVLDIRGRSSHGRASELERPNLVIGFTAEVDMPAGKVEMYEMVSDSSTILSGGTWLPETIKGDRGRLIMGESLAVRVQRIKTDSQQQGAVVQVRWKTTIFNDQKEDITFVLNDLDRSLVKISDVNGGKLGETYSIQVNVPANGEKQISYMGVYGI